MFNNIDNITQRALKALEAAQTAAEQTHYPQIEPAHLLVGLARTPGSLASTVLVELGITEATLFAAVREVLPEPTTSAAPIQTLAISPAFGKTLELAQAEAKRQGDDFLATEHLLLGLLNQQSPIVVEVLKKHQVRVENVRYAMQHLLAEADASQPTRPPQLDARIAAHKAAQNANAPAPPLSRLLQPLVSLWQRLTGKASAH